ncbi:MAG: S49 family peptidase [Alphaproteobacteria bacterium]|nr:S49 family peptidase [Alphaproteobacteria bacterium]
MAEHIRQLTGRAAAVIRPYLPRRLRSDLPVVPVVRLTGVIGFSTPLRPGLSIAGLARMLERAFAVRHARAVALAINSPGGSAVQSHLIYRRIRALAKEKKLPVIAFVEDVAASGGYMIACAADEIVCDPASIVGSIGVIGASFGFPEALKKLGIERRIYTAGEHKSTLDPFLPEDENDVTRIKAIQQDIHAMFIGLVRERRGERLTGPENTVFSGEYWVAKTAKELGLVDQLGDVRSFLRERFGEDVVMPPVPAERSLFGRRTPGVTDVAPGALLRLGGEPHGLVDDFISALEARAMWAKFGL